MLRTSELYSDRMGQHKGIYNILERKFYILQNGAEISNYNLSIGRVTCKQ